MKQLITSIFLCVLYSQIYAVQNKYALLIGINQYQIKDKSGKTILDPANALYGCMNDAESIRELLINKFNFNKENITTLYNVAASKKNILKQIDILLSKCKKGDVAVVYYAGHGMPFRYGKDDEEIAEVILPSNAFATVPFAYIQQTELAVKFNLFVDKDVTLTTIFDCCFSLATDRNGIVMTTKKLSSEDSARIKNDSIAKDANWGKREEPSDANEYELITEQADDSNSTDLINNELALESEGLMPNRGITLKQYREMTKNIIPYGFIKADTTYNPPSQRNNSKFVFLSATNDMQTAPEMRDEKGKSHGAFTYAFTKIFETNPVTISFREAFNKTVIKLKELGKEITPSARYKPNQRENKNMFGIQPDELKLKVYLPVESCTFNELNAMYKKWVMPLNEGKKKSLALTKSNPLCSKVYILNKGKNVFYVDGKTKKKYKISNIDTLKSYIKEQPFFIYLPIPKVLSDNIRTECMKNKRIELVVDIMKADFSLYCTNYSTEKNGLMNNVKDITMNLTDDIINYDYRDKLCFVGNNETVGVMRNKPGHFNIPNDQIIIPATESIENISKKMASWLNAKTGK